MSESVATNLLGRHAQWLGSRGPSGGTIVAVTFYQGGFVLLLSTDEGLQTRNASGVTISS